MKIASIFILVLCINFTGYGQYISVDELLNKVEKEYSLSINNRFKISGNGVHRSDSHLTNRNQLNQYELAYELECNNSNIYFSNQLVNQSSKKEYVNKSQYIDDTEYVLTTSKNEYFKTHPNNNVSNILRTYYLSPSLLIQYIIKNRSNLAFSLTKKENIYVLNIQFSNAENWVLTISNDYLCQSFCYANFDYLYGDVKEKIIWGNYRKTEFGPFPEKILVNKNGFEAYNLTQKIDTLTNENAFIDVTQAKIKKEKKQKERIISEDSILIKKIADGLFEIELRETNNRLLIAEFENFLILLEGSYHSKNGDLIIKIIQEKFPNKAIKYASFSHCHTQYIGMSRSYAANGISIITTNDNFNFIKKITSASFSKRPDKQEIEPAEPIFEEITNDWNYSDNFNSMEIYNIESDHTENYLVYYFPRSKLMFVGDMLWVSNNEPNALLGRSLVFYDEVVNRLNLEIETFYTSWPLNYYNVKSIVHKGEIITE